MLGLRRKFKMPNSTKELVIFQKPWSDKLGIDRAVSKQYMLVETSDYKTFKIIDNVGETDGFETYRGAEQFARAYILNNHSVIPERWNIEKYPNSENGRLKDKTGVEIEI